MDFHYYYLIQDLTALLLIFIGLRMLSFCIKMLSGKKFSKNILLLIIQYILVILSGLPLLLSSFGLKPWIYCGVILIISKIISPKYKATE